MSFKLDLICARVLLKRRSTMYHVLKRFFTLWTLLTFPQAELKKQTEGDVMQNPISSLEFEMSEMKMSSRNIKGQTSADRLDRSSGSRDSVGLDNLSILSQGVAWAFKCPIACWAQFLAVNIAEAQTRISSSNTSDSLSKSVPLSDIYSVPLPQCFTVLTWTCLRKQVIILF